MMGLFDDAWRRSSFGEIALVLRSLKAGLYSRCEELTEKAVKLI
jgi:hypothetical protein